MKQIRKTPVGYESSIMNGHLYFEDAKQCALADEVAADMFDDKYLRSVRVISLSSHWVEHVWYSIDTKRIEDINLEMTLRKEIRSGKAYWYAYRRVLGVLHKRYVGTSEQLTEQKLVDIARKLPSR